MKCANRLVLFLGVGLLASCAASRPQSALDWSPLEPHLAGVTQLTFDGDNGEAYFSWDDTRLIWQSNRGGAACDKIWTMAVDGSDKERVSPANGAHTCAYFVPGDEHIVFSSTSHLPGDCPPRPPQPEGQRYVWPLFPYDLFIARADGTETRRLTRNPKYDAEPIVHPDGKRLVFGSQRDGDFDIYTMNLDGTGLQRLTDTVGYDGGPWWSPDGSRIAWRAWHPRSDADKALWQTCMENDYIVPVPLDLWVMNADGTDKRRLTDNGATNWAPSWTPDGKRLIFSSNMDDWRADIQRFGHNFELYLVNADGTGLERLTFNDVFDSFPMFSHNGRKLVWASNRNPEKPRATDIYIADWID